MTNLTNFQIRFIVFVQVKKKLLVSDADFKCSLSADHLHVIKNTGVLNYFVYLIYFLRLNKYYMSK